VSAPTLSAGQMLLLQGLRPGWRLISKLGPLQGCIPRLEELGLVERVAPGRSPARTMLQLTEAGRAALPAKKPKD
jgi:hypothetical protein